MVAEPAKSVRSFTTSEILDATPVTIGERVRRLREERGWTLSDLGGRMGARSYLYQVERGKSSPTLGWLERCAAAFDMSVLELLGPLYGPEPDLAPEWEAAADAWHHFNDACENLTDSLDRLSRAEERRRLAEPRQGVAV